MIEITVGLPMYRSRYIGWLALESLCRQKDVNFDWELLIMEEKDDALGLDVIRQYIPRLKENRCVRLEYYSLEEWVPLSYKWKELADKSSDSSGFLLQAADCYSQPHRLRETYDLFKRDQDPDWVQSKKGFFYDIGSDSTVVFNHDLCMVSTLQGHKSHPCSLNMAVKTSLLKKIEHHAVKKSVDSFLFRRLSELKGSPLEVGWNLSENWRYGVDTHGLNNISLQRGASIKQAVPPFEATNEEMSNVLPEDIWEKLLQCQKTALERRYYALGRKKRGVYAV